MATVEEFVQSVKDSLPFLRKLERGQRRAYAIFGGVGGDLPAEPDLQSAVTVSHNKTTDIISKCDKVIEVFNQLKEAISAVQATEFPDPNPVIVAEEDFDKAQDILDEVGTAYKEIAEPVSATSLGLAVGPLQLKTEHS